MCGRYYVPADELFIQQIATILDEISEKYAGSPEHDAMKTGGEIFPSEIIPIVTGNGAELASWGFPSAFNERVVMNPRDGKKVSKSQREDINAKSETLLSGMSKGAGHAARYGYWKDDIFVRRVAIPSGGFFEWPRDPSIPYTKYLFRLPENELVYLAGMFRYFSDVKKGMTRRVVILTTAANESVAPYHNRMPVLLRKEEVEAWLSDGSVAQEILRRTPPLLEVVRFDEPANKPTSAQLSMFDWAEALGPI